METIKTWKIFILTHSILFWYKPFFWPMPKFGPTPILWTHANHAKISTHATHAIFFDPRQNFNGPTPPMPLTPKFDPHHPRTHAPTLPRPPTLFSRLLYCKTPYYLTFWKGKSKENLHKELFTKENQKSIQNPVKVEFLQK